MHTGHRVFILTEAQTCINTHVSCMPLFFVSVSTPTRKSSHKPRQLAPTVGVMRSSYVRSMAFQSATKFLPSSRWALRSLLFIADKFGDLSLQEPESLKVTGLGTVHLPPASVQVGLVSEAQLGHESFELCEVGSDPLGDKADHNWASSPATVDPIYQSPPDSDSEGDREVFMAR
jgi:hypothetical protein